MKKVFESQALQYPIECYNVYATMEDAQAAKDSWDGVFHGPGQGNENGAYHLDLCVYPRQYEVSMYEGSASFSGLVVIPKKTPTSDFVIWLSGMHSATYWPSYEAFGYEWDGGSGQFITAMDNLVGDNESIWNERNWRTERRNAAFWTQGAFFGVVDDDWAEQSWNGGTDFAYTGVTIPTEAFAASPLGAETLANGSAKAFDRASGQVLVGSTVWTADDPCLFVCNFPTFTGNVADAGSIQVERIIPMPYHPSKVFWEEDDRAFVVCDESIIVLCNTMTGEIISVDRYPFMGSAYETVATYDFLNKRVLIAERTPDAEDGQSTIKVHGYIPGPVGARLTSPVHLKRGVVDRQVKAVTRLVTGAGQPIVGSLVNATITGGSNGALVSPKVNIAADGYAIFAIDCNTPGDVTLNVSTEV